eukprot:Trichotokara_eunicae@DN10093_c0_g1_i1.p1
MQAVRILDEDEKREQEKKTVAFKEVNVPPSITRRDNPRRSISQYHVRPPNLDIASRVKSFEPRTGPSREQRIQRADTQIVQNKKSETAGAAAMETKRSRTPTRAKWITFETTRSNSPRTSSASDGSRCV